jgi:hypothetical protein
MEPVEAGSSTTDWKALIAAVATPFVNAGLAHIGLAVTPDQIMMIEGALALWIGARTARKALATHAEASVAVASAQSAAPAPAAPKPA